MSGKLASYDPYTHFGYGKVPAEVRGSFHIFQNTKYVKEHR